MVKKFLIVFFLIFISYGSETGSLTFRAKTQLDKGNLKKAMSLLNRAETSNLKSSRSEDEKRLLLNKALLEIHAQRFEASDSLIALANTIDSSDAHSRLYSLLLNMRSSNGQKKYLQTLQSFKKFELEKANFSKDDLACQVVMEAAVASASAQTKQEDMLLEKTEDCEDNFPGAFSLTKAKIFMAQAKAKDALNQLQIALESAQAASVIYRIGEILYLSGKCMQALKLNSDAIEFFERAAALYKELGLQIPYIKCIRRIVEIDPQNQAYQDILKHSN